VDRNLPRRIVGGPPIAGGIPNRMVKPHRSILPPGETSSSATGRANAPLKPQDLRPASGRRTAATQRGRGGRSYPAPPEDVTGADNSGTEVQRRGTHMPQHAAGERENIRATLQDGKLTGSARHYPKERLPHLARHCGRVSSHTSVEGRRTIHLHHMEGSCVEMESTPIRVIRSTQNLHEGNEDPDLLLKKSGNQGCSIPGRPPNNGGVRGAVRRAYGQGERTADVPGIHVESQEVRTQPIKGNHLSWHGHQLGEYVLQSPRFEVEATKGRPPEDIRVDPRYCETTRGNSGEAELDDPYEFDRQTQAAPAAQSQTYDSATRERTVGSTGEDVGNIEKSDEVVDRPLRRVERQTDCAGGGAFDGLLGRFRHGLGSSVGAPRPAANRSKRNLDGGERTPSHQHKRVVGVGIGASAVRGIDRGFSEESAPPSEGCDPMVGGQHSSLIPRSETGRKECRGVDVLGTYCEVDTRQRVGDPPGLHCLGGECSGRQTVEGIAGNGKQPTGMEVARGRFLAGDESVEVPSGSRFIRLPAERTTAAVCVVEGGCTRSHQRRVTDPHQPLGEEPIREPTLESGRSAAASHSAAESSDNGVGVSILGALQPAMVAAVEADVGQQANQIATPSAHRGMAGLQPVEGHYCTGIGYWCEISGLPAEAAVGLLETDRPATQKRNRQLVKRWDAWIASQPERVFTFELLVTSPHSALWQLTGLLDRYAQDCTVSSVELTMFLISTLIGLRSGGKVSIASHPAVKRLFKKLRERQRRTTEAERAAVQPVEEDGGERNQPPLDILPMAPDRLQPWQVLGTVARALKNAPPWHLQEMVQLRTHLSFILHVNLVCRPFDLQRILLNELRRTTILDESSPTGFREGRRIRLLCGKESARPVDLEVAATPETPWCCPVAALDCYLERSEEMRRVVQPAQAEGNGEVPFLFVGNKSTRGNDGRYQRNAIFVSSECLSQQIVKLVTRLGLPTVRAKNLRSLSATAARDFGIEERFVLKRGRWKRAETFDQHYDRPLEGWRAQAQDLLWRSESDMRPPLCFARILPWAALMMDVGIANGMQRLDPGSGDPGGDLRSV
jgi:hypothetical protein